MIEIISETNMNSRAVKNGSRNEHGNEISRLKERVKGTKAPVGQRNAEILKNEWA